jgi:hypothetical protein
MIFLLTLLFGQSMNLNVQPIIVKDEGVQQSSTRAATINCTGAGVTCSQSGTTMTINAAGGGGGGGNFVEESVSVVGPYQEAVVVAAWATASSKIICAPYPTSADGLTPELVAVAGIQATASGAAGSFTLRVVSPFGVTGTVRIHCTGG